MIKTVYRTFSAGLIYLLFLQVNHAQTVIPSDPQTSGCSVDQITFNWWFGGALPVINSPSVADAGCFGCHSISGTDAADGNGVEVSHIYDEILPLPELQVLNKARSKNGLK